MLAKVRTGPRHHDPQLAGDGDIKSPRLRRSGQGQRALGAAQPALAVGHQRKMRLITAHPPVSPELSKGRLEVAACVRAQPRRFAHDGHPRRQPTSNDRMLPRLLRLGVDQDAGHRQVPPDPLGQLLGQGAELRRAPRDRGRTRSRLQRSPVLRRAVVPARPTQRSSHRDWSPIEKLIPALMTWSPSLEGDLIWARARLTADPSTTRTWSS